MQKGDMHEYKEMHKEGERTAICHRKHNVVEVIQYTSSSGLLVEKC